MSRIPPALIAETARVWHRFELRPGEAEAIAKALEPIDAAAEAHAAELGFEAEPSHYDRLLKGAK